MALMALRASLVAALTVTCIASAVGQQALPPPDAAPSGSPGTSPDKPAGAFKADPDTPTDAEKKEDVWIFSGNLQGSNESFSGTLVANPKGEAQFEMRLGAGATCNGSQLKGEVGLVRLPEINCSDGRAMRALFVPQGGQELKVFGHVGEQRFMASAHILGTEDVPERKQTAQPKGPLGRPPMPSGPGEPPVPVPPLPKGPPPG